MQQNTSARNSMQLALMRIHAAGCCNSIAHGFQVIIGGIGSFLRSIVEGIRSCVSGIFGSCRYAVPAGEPFAQSCNSYS